MSGDTCPWCGANIVCGKDYSCGSDSYGAVPHQSDLCKYRCAERRLSELGSELSLAAETIKRQAQRIEELESALSVYQNRYIVTGEIRMERAAKAGGEA